MKKKSTRYDTPDGGGWMHACDSLFLAQFRGKPCEVCGVTEAMFNGRKIRSMGHHLLSKELHRVYRYDPQNIVVLCVHHHLGAEMSPHSHDVASQAAFYDWLRDNRPEKYDFMLSHRLEKFNKQWAYRSMYEDLGGEITKEKDGKKLPMKLWKPKNHATKVREAEGQ